MMIQYPEKGFGFSFDPKLLEAAAAAWARI